MQDKLVEIVVALMKMGKSFDYAISTLNDLCQDTELIERVRQLILDDLSKPRKLKDPPSLVADDDANQYWYLGPSLTQDKYWPSLLKYLNEKKWSQEAIDSIDQSSTKIISLLSHPGIGEFSKRGLVIGYIQSGKTANYTAVIAKAADVGYKLFIVLSGITNKLRRQTQERLNKELVNLNSPDWNSLTSLDTDFSTRSNINVNALLGKRADLRYLCVIKKNQAPLRKLVEWLKGASEDVIRDCPVLVIDDESDQASLNIQKEQNERSTINHLILEMLGTLPKVAYIGYTASPFANVLVDPSIYEGLYPRDFIIDLPKPLGYFGPEAIFGRDRLQFDEFEDDLEGLDMIRVIPDEEATELKPTPNQREFFEPSITPSLEQALKYFWMATAARIVRGQIESDSKVINEEESTQKSKSDHSTMLIHTTLYADSQLQQATPVSEFKDLILKSLLDYDETLIKELKELWRNEQARVPSSEMQLESVDFDDLFNYLTEVVSRTQVIVENHLVPEDERLKYEEGPGIFIVIGGNILSRGLTLEGLVVSFFLRTADAYDTLLQMGRWFGYRPGYEDLPRMWMTQELKNYFYDLATIEQEIRYDIRRYESEKLTPLDFGVRIRTHPMLSITSRLKMQSARPCQISYSNTRQQTAIFNIKDEEWLINNINVTDSLIRNLRTEDSMNYRFVDGNRWIFNEVDVQYILNFLNEYLIHENSIHIKNQLLRGYIEEQNKTGRLTKWNVVIRSRKESELGTINLGGLDVNLINRAKVGSEYEPDSIDNPVANLKAIVSKIDLVADFENIEEFSRLTQDDLFQKRIEKVPDTGLLLIYPISKDSRPKGGSKNSIALNAIEHLIGIGIVFPKSEIDTPLAYMSVDLSRVEREHEEYPVEEED